MTFFLNMTRQNGYLFHSFKTLLSFVKSIDYVLYLRLHFYFHVAICRYRLKKCYSMYRLSTINQKRTRAHTGSQVTPTQQAETRNHC